MGKIICGARSYSVKDIPDNANYEITPPYRAKGEVELGIIQDFASLLVRGYKLAKVKPIPAVLRSSWVKGFINGSDNDNELQKRYLKEARKVFETRYSLDELLWFRDFRLYINEIGGKVSDNWYLMYQIVLGDLPSDYPNGISVPDLLDNVLLRLAQRYTGKTLDDFFKAHPETIVDLKRGIVPEGITLKPELGLTVESYIRLAGSLDKRS